MQSWGRKKAVLPHLPRENVQVRRAGPWMRVLSAAPLSFLDPQTSFRIALYNCNINLTFHFYSSGLKRIGFKKSLTHTQTSRMQGRAWSIFIFYIRYFP